MPYECYIGYLKANPEETKPEIINGEELVIEARDLDTFERLVLKVLVAEPPNTIDGGEELWVLDWIEKKMDAPWSIKVLEELEEDALGDSRSDIGQADLTSASEESQKFGGTKYRGSQMAEMMGQEEARKFFENVVQKKKS